MFEAPKLPTPPKLCQVSKEHTPTKISSEVIENAKTGNPEKVTERTDNIMENETSNSPSPTCPGEAARKTKKKLKKQNKLETSTKKKTPSKVVASLIRTPVRASSKIKTQGPTSKFSTPVKVPLERTPSEPSSSSTINEARTNQATVNDSASIEVIEIIDNTITPKKHYEEPLKDEPDTSTKLRSPPPSRTRVRSKKTQKRIVASLIKTPVRTPSKNKNQIQDPTSILSTPAKLRQVSIERTPRSPSSSEVNNELTPPFIVDETPKKHYEIPLKDEPERSTKLTSPPPPKNAGTSMRKWTTPMIRSTVLMTQSQCKAALNNPTTPFERSFERDVGKQPKRKEQKRRTIEIIDNTITAKKHYEEPLKDEPDTSTKLRSPPPSRTRIRSKKTQKRIVASLIKTPVRTPSKNKNQIQDPAPMLSTPAKLRQVSIERTPRSPSSEVNNEFKTTPFIVDETPKKHYEKPLKDEPERSTKLTSPPPPKKAGKSMRKWTTPMIRSTLLMTQSQCKAALNNPTTPFERSFERDVVKQPKRKKRKVESGDNQVVVKYSPWKVSSTKPKRARQSILEKFCQVSEQMAGTPKEQKRRSKSEKSSEKIESSIMKTTPAKVVIIEYRTPPAAVKESAVIDKTHTPQKYYEIALQDEEPVGSKKLWSPPSSRKRVRSKKPKTSETRTSRTPSEIKMQQQDPALKLPTPVKQRHKSRPKIVASLVCSPIIIRKLKAAVNDSETQHDRSPVESRPKKKRKVSVATTDIVKISPWKIVPKTHHQRSSPKKVPTQVSKELTPAQHSNPEVQPVEKSIGPKSAEKCNRSLEKDSADEPQLNVAPVEEPKLHKPKRWRQRKYTPKKVNISSPGSSDNIVKGSAMVHTPKLGKPRKHTPQKVNISSPGSSKNKVKGSAQKSVKFAEAVPSSSTRTHATYESELLEPVNSTQSDMDYNDSNEESPVGGKKQKNLYNKTCRAQETPKQQQSASGVKEDILTIYVSSDSSDSDEFEVPDFATYAHERSQISRMANETDSDDIEVIDDYLRAIRDKTFEKSKWTTMLQSSRVHRATATPKPQQKSRMSQGNLSNIDRTGFITVYSGNPLAPPEKGIIFNTDMVKKALGPALTRRVLKGHNFTRAIPESATCYYAPYNPNVIELPSILDEFSDSDDDGTPVGRLKFFKVDGEPLL